MAALITLQQIAQAFTLFEADHGYLPSAKTKIPGASFPISYALRFSILATKNSARGYCLHHEWDSRVNAGFLDPMT
ncbi:MAG: hypothetical protein VXZ82_15275 [Planctomycetota bacterium]|nr:hypothetical protein [Planctomycetota bacterium]